MSTSFNLRNFVGVVHDQRPNAAKASVRGLASLSNGMPPIREILAESP
jgi:hypothetical protein